VPDPPVMPGPLFPPVGTLGFPAVGALELPAGACIEQFCVHALAELSLFGVVSFEHPAIRNNNTIANMRSRPLETRIAALLR
jgi:hypothetical protein